MKFMDMLKVSFSILWKQKWLVLLAFLAQILSTYMSNFTTEMSAYSYFYTDMGVAYTIINIFSYVLSLAAFLISIYVGFIATNATVRIAKEGLETKSLKIKELMALGKKDWLKVVLIKFITLIPTLFLGLIFAVLAAVTILGGSFNLSTVTSLANASSPTGIYNYFTNLLTGVSIPLVILLCGLGLFILAVSVILNVVYMFAMFNVVLDGAGVTDSIKFSLNFIKTNLKQVALLVFVYGLLIGIVYSVVSGAIMGGVGFISGLTSVITMTSPWVSLIAFLFTNIIVSVVTVLLSSIEGVYMNLFYTRGYLDIKGKK